MKKRFNSLWSAVIYFSLVVIMFGLVVAGSIINKWSVIILISASFLVGVYLNKLIKTFMVMRQMNKIKRTTRNIMLAFGFPKEIIKKQEKDFNKKSSYIIK